MSNRPDKPLDQYPAAELPPLPPAGAPGEDAALAAAPEPKAAPKPEVAVLRFLDPAARALTLPLSHPFEHEGEVIESITVRRLITAEVGAVVEAHPQNAPGLFDFYAAMTGLPASVLRGLDDDDGSQLLEVARPLLCRFARDHFYSPTSGAGADTPSAPPAV